MIEFGLPIQSEFMSILNVHLSPGHYEDEGKFEQDAFNQFSFTVSPHGCLMDAMGCGTHLLSPEHQEAVSVVKTAQLFVLITTWGMVDVSLILQGFALSWDHHCLHKRQLHPIGTN